MDIIRTISKAFEPEPPPRSLLHRRGFDVVRACPSGLRGGSAKAAAGMPHPSGASGGIQALAFWDWDKLVAATSAAEITAYTALALSVMAAAIAAVSYALSRVPQHVSVE